MGRPRRPGATALPAELSGGERQRAALARAVILSPEVILADEPTGGVDREAALRPARRSWSSSTAMGKTVLVATHDPDLLDAARGPGRGPGARASPTAGSAGRRRRRERRRWPRSAGSRGDPARPACCRRARPPSALPAASSRRCSPSSRCWRWRWRWRPGRLADDLAGASSPTTATLQVFAPEDEIEEQARAALDVLRDHARGALGADGRPRRAGEAARALARAGHPDGEPAAAADDRGRDRPRRARPGGAGGAAAGRGAGRGLRRPCRLAAAAGRHRRAAAALRARRPRPRSRWRWPRCSALAAQAAVAANGAGDRDAAARRRARRLHRRRASPAGWSLARGRRARRRAPRRRWCSLALLPPGERAGLLPRRASASPAGTGLLPLLVPPAAGAARLGGGRARPRAAACGAGAERRVLLVRSLVFDALLYLTMAVMGILGAPLRALVGRWRLRGLPGLLPRGLLPPAGDLRAPGRGARARCRRARCWSPPSTSRSSTS